MGIHGATALVAILCAATVHDAATMPGDVVADQVAGVASFSTASYTGTARHGKEEVRESRIGGFSASLFKFKIVVEDDGKNASGGWQAAHTTLALVDGRHPSSEGLGL